VQDPAGHIDTYCNLQSSYLLIVISLSGCLMPRK